ncbi:hypothetical protein Hanom_Chr14g01318921 [Helianthus anomalus]
MVIWVSSSMATPLKSQCRYSVLDRLIVRPLPSKATRHSSILSFRHCLVSAINTISSAKSMHIGIVS